MRKNIALSITAVLSLCLAGLALAQARPRPGRPMVRPMPGRGKPAVVDPFKTVQGAQLVFTADLKSAQAGPVGMSMPPLYTHKLSIVVKEVLRGDVKPGDTLTLSHSARQMKKPTFPVGQVCLITASKSRGHTIAKFVRKADAALMKTAKDAASLPLGWSKKGDKFVSPWAGLGAGAWPKSAKPVKGSVVCSVTGRPAKLGGAGISMKVEKVPPIKNVKWSNPDGDGEYTIIIKNETDKPIKVPALLSDGKGVLWNESLVVLCQGKARPAPGAKGVKTGAKATVLKANESITTVVNAFLLKGIRWPRGGYRVEFQFCLGEMSQTKSFYYRSKHHDPIRAAALANLKK